MLELRNLVKEFYQKFGIIRVVDRINLEVKKGEVFGFLGPNGAGKTTTVKMVTGLLYPTSGSIRVGGRLAGSLESQKIIGYMSENPSFYIHLKAREVLEFVGELFSIEHDKLNSLTQELLEQVGLQGKGEVPVRQFSKGMHQRLAFACAMINDPQLLILDEPLDGLDPIGRLDFKRLIKKWRHEGRTIFLSSHILSDVEELCDRIAILNKGRIVASGAPKDLLKGNLTLEEYFVEKVRSDV